VKRKRKGKIVQTIIILDEDEQKELNYHSQSFQNIESQIKQLAMQREIERIAINRIGSSAIYRNQRDGLKIGDLLPEILQPNGSSMWKIEKDKLIIDIPEKAKNELQ
jgi:hypothetical protein